MLKRIMILSALTLVATMTAVASSDREDDVKRSRRAAGSLPGAIMEMRRPTSW